MASLSPSMCLASASSTSSNSQATQSTPHPGSRPNIWEVPTCIAADYYDLFYQDSKTEIDFAILEEYPEIKIDVQRCIQQMGPIHQQVFDMLYQQGLSQKETALNIGLSQSRIAQLHAEMLVQGQRHLAVYAA